jgi:hypothetical protein
MQIKYRMVAGKGMFIEEVNLRYTTEEGLPAY